MKKHLTFILVIIPGIFIFSQKNISVKAKDKFSGTVERLSFYHDYSQTLVMKIMNATVNEDGSCNVVCNFEETLNIIKKVDNITLQVPKILYLVGWQYNGHDDKYPAFFEVNKHLKRRQDSTALQSLQWLIREARKYHTTVSLHINMTDCYSNSPLWKDYLDKDMISKNADGSLKVIGHYNNHDSYQINYKHEWENGYAQMRIDKLLNLLPELKQSATIHLDAWIARPSEGDCETDVTEAEYQKKVVVYWHNKGVDVTGEMAFDYLTGYVPLAYHFYKVNQAFYLNIPANVYAGSDFNPDVPTDIGLGFLFGISMNGESVFPNDWNNFDDRWYLPTSKQILPKGNWKELKKTYWTNIFMNEFYLHCPQYFFLNKLKRLKVEGKGNERVACFSNNVYVSLKDSTVIKNNQILRDKNLIFFPAEWLHHSEYVMYSPFDTTAVISIPLEWRKYKYIKIEEVTETGKELRNTLSLNSPQLKISLKGNKPFLLTPM